MRPCERALRKMRPNEGHSDEDSEKKVCVVEVAVVCGEDQYLGLQSIWAICWRVCALACLLCDCSCVACESVHDYGLLHCIILY